MGNKKNKERYNTRKRGHVYGKKSKPTNDNKVTDNRIDEEIISQHQKTSDGSRIINLDNLRKYTNALIEHTKHCGGSIAMTDWFSVSFYWRVSSLWSHHHFGDIKKK